MTTTITKSVERLNGHRYVTFRINEKLIGVLYPKPRAKSECYISRWIYPNGNLWHVKETYRYTDIRRAITLTILDLASDNNLLWQEDAKDFEDKVDKMQTNSSGWKADLKRSLAPVFA